MGLILYIGFQETPDEERFHSIHFFPEPAARPRPFLKIKIPDRGRGEGSGKFHYRFRHLQFPTQAFGFRGRGGKASARENVQGQSNHHRFLRITDCSIG